MSRKRLEAAVGQAELRLALDGVSGPATGVLAATLSSRATSRQLCGDELEFDVNQSAGRHLQTSTMRGFYMGHPEFAAKLASRSAACQDAASPAETSTVCGEAPPSPPSKKLVAHANAAEIFLDVAGHHQLFPSEQAI